MKIIKVKLASPYPIYIGSDALDGLWRLIQRTNIGSDAVIITSAKIFGLHGRKVLKQINRVCSSQLILNVADSEKSKNAELVFHLIKKITSFDVKKSLFLVALGGGVIGDLTGFIAAIYKRGVPYIQIPTTLLAQIDSSIGGKTAIDTAFGKNLVGAFYQPRFIISDLKLLNTLPRDQISSGLSEAVKYAVIKDPYLFSFLQKKYRDLLILRPNVLKHLVIRCVAIKAKLVAEDEFDKKDKRIILNFGHTIGHGIETASNFKISHGYAVSAGMIGACKLSERLGLLNPEESFKIINLIKQMQLIKDLKGIGLSDILKSIAHDKKSIEGANRFVLIERIGKTKIIKNIPQNLIKDVVRQLLAGKN